MADTQTILALIGLAIFDGLLVFGFWLYVHIDSRRTMDRITRMGYVPNGRRLRKSKEKP